MFKVLCVEDIQDHRDLLAQILEQEGYQVATARDGMEGIELAHTLTPDLILMDLRMPRMDGFEAIRNIRLLEDKLIANTPIIAISALNDTNSKQRALTAGANDYLDKPLDSEQLIESIQRYLAHSPLEDESFRPHLPVPVIRFSSKDNPYVAGPPIKDPRMFFGRQADLEKIINLLMSNFIMLIGPRRIGKTSLLHQLLYHLPHLEQTEERFAPVLVNTEGIPEAEFFHAVMEEILETGQKYLPSETANYLSFDLANSTYPARAFSRDFHSILKGLQSTKPEPTRLVLLMDEMDTLNRYSMETQAQLRRIFQRFANANLSVVVAGVKLYQQWAGESSPFYNMFVPITLTPFLETEARHLITEPVKGKYSYSDEAITRILETTLGLPHRIQQLCLETIDHLLTTTRGRRQISFEDVNTVLQTIHWQDEEEKFLSITREEFEELKEGKERSSRLNAILASMADGVIVRDLAGRILVMNPAAEGILKAMVDIEGDQAQGKEKLSILSKHLTALQIEGTQRFELGRRVLSARSAPVVSSEGEQLGSVIVLRDITQEVETERLKDDFIATVSHELRTPLTAIKGYNELLRMTAANQLDERQLGFIETIDKNVVNLLQLIQQMIDLSVINAGILSSIDKEPVNLSALIAEEANKWAGKMAEKGLAFFCHLPDEPIWVESDWNRLSQVVHNLIRNAYDYTLPKGRAEVLLKKEGDRARVDVKDSGIGIAKKDQRFLFTRFFRAVPESTYELVNGAGLGLYISKAIIEAYNGQIWVESEPGRGSTFSFALPMIPLQPLEV